MLQVSSCHIVLSYRASLSAKVANLSLSQKTRTEYVSKITDDDSLSILMHVATVALAKHSAISAEITS